MSTAHPFFPTSETYKPIGGNLLVLDYVPDSVDPLSYARSCSGKSEVVLHNHYHNHEVYVEVLDAAPLVLGSKTTLTEDQIEACPYNLREQSKARSRDSMSRQYDVEILKVINTAVPADHSVTCSGEFLPEILLRAMTLLREHELEVGNIVMHPQGWKHVLGWSVAHRKEDREWLVIHSRKKRERTGIYGYFFEVPILVATMVPKNAIFILGEKEYVGVQNQYGEYMEDTVVKADGDEVTTLTWKVGFLIVNDYALARIIIS